MNPDYDQQLEAQIDRALKALPELEAPPTLRGRVLAAIERRSAVPWYRQPWQDWNLAWRTISLALLLSGFAALCLAAWQLTRAAGFELAADEVGKVFSGLNVLWNTITVLVGAVGMVLKHFGTGVIVAGLLLIGFGYAVTLALGTVYFRLALARR